LSCPVFAVLLALTLPQCAGAQEADANLPTDKARMQRLQSAIIAAEEACTDPQDPAYRTNLPFAALQLKKATLAAADPWASARNGAKTFIDRGMEALERLAAGQRYLAEPGKLSELAYIAKCDGTVQPYYVHLPTNYDPQRPWPLIVFLHGYVPSITVLAPWILDEDICQIAEDNGCILLIPYGRRNTDFQGVGEVDVLDSIEEVKALYNIDPLRVYMSGTSMGGMGAWNITLRHPGMFAATTPITGQTDMHAWWPRALPNWPASRDDLQPFRRFLVEWDNPIDLVTNARNQPIFLQHGERDSLIPVQQSRDIIAAAARLGIDIKYHEFKGETHYIYWDKPCFQNAWGWSREQTLNTAPERVTYKTYSLEYDTAFWLRIVEFERWGIPAEVDCEVTDDGASLRIDTKNVALLHIDVQKAPLQKVEDFTAIVNGEETDLRATANWDLYVVCSPDWSPERAETRWPPMKRKGLCGPVEEVFDQPFLLVVGAAGDEAADEANFAKAKQWITDWDQFSDGVPRIALDSEVKEEDIERFNLVLIGEPSSNSVIARIADRLPIKIGDHQYEVAGRTYQGDDLGLVMCYPNPLAPDNYVAIYAGELYGEKCGINHKHDLIPDFIVFNTRVFEFDDTNQHEVAGYFDMDWKLSDKLTWVR